MLFHILQGWLLSIKGIKDIKLMERPTASPDINLTEKLWSFIKRGVHENGKQSWTNKDIWEAIKTAASNVKVMTVKMSVHEK